MHNVIARNWKDVEKYRTKIFKSKEMCRKEFSKLPFEEKLEISYDLYEFAVEFKKSKRTEK